VPLDPQIQALFGGATSLPALPMSLDGMRGFYQARSLPGLKVGSVASAWDDEISSSDIPLKVRVYTPLGDGPWPILIYFHGGGFVAGNLDSHDSIARNLCAGARYVVVSVDYRLAPEHKFPAAIKDALMALNWAATHASKLNADANRIVVGGDSAGGNLAAVTALRNRDEGGPMLAGQLLIYPVIAHPTLGTRSYSENGEGYLLTRRIMEFFWEHYLNDQSEAQHPHASPLYAADLTGLPSALIFTAEFDPLRDEAEQYGRKLRAAGVPTRISRCDGMIHGFFGLAGIVNKTDAALGEACAWLQQGDCL
jgi:acetyl esterase